MQTVLQTNMQQMEWVDVVKGLVQLVQTYLTSKQWLGNGFYSLTKQKAKKSPNNSVNTCQISYSVSVCLVHVCDRSHYSTKQEQNNTY